MFIGRRQKARTCGEEEDDRTTHALARGQVQGCQCCVHAVGGVGGLVRAWCVLWSNRMGDAAKRRGSKSKRLLLVAHYPPLPHLDNTKERSEKQDTARIEAWPAAATT